MYSMKHPVRIFLMIMLSASMLSSCKVDQDLAKPSFTPDFILPLVYGDLNLKNITKDSSAIQTDPSGYFKVVVQDTVFEQNLGEQIAVFQNMPDIPLPVFFTSAGPNQVLNSQEFNYDVFVFAQLAKLKKMNLNAGTLTIKINNGKNFSFDNITVTIPGLVRNGVPYTSGTIASIPAGTTHTINVDLANSQWSLIGKAGDTSSTVYVQMNTSAPSQGASGGNATFSIALNNLDLSYSEGRYSSFPLPIFTSSANVLPATFYQRIKSGSLTLKDAEIKLNFDNTVGIPYAIDVELGTVNGVNGNVRILDPGVMVIQQADLGPVSKSNIFVLDDSNNLGPVISNFPQALTVKARVGDTLNNPDPLGYFVYKNSALKLYVEAEIPFAVHFDNLVLKDTLNFSLLSNLGENFQDTATYKLDRGEFTFDMVNGFPYDLEFNINAFNSMKDSIAQVAAFQIAGAQTSIVGGQEKVVNPRYSTFNIDISQALFERLKSAKFLEVTAKMNTPVGVVSPRIYTDYTLGFDVKGRIKIMAKPL